MTTTNDEILSALADLHEDIRTALPRPATTQGVTCPPWCEEPDCKGEHRANVAVRVPATAGVPRMSEYGWFTFPAVSVALVHDEVDHLPPGVCVHLYSDTDDVEAAMTLREARALHANLTEAIAAATDNRPLRQPVNPWDISTWVPTDEEAAR